MWIWAVVLCWVSLGRSGGCIFDESTDSAARLRLKTFDGNDSREQCATLAGQTTPRSSNDGFPMVKLFLFHHEEPELLADWLQYHGAVFGLSNLHVIDHQSNDDSICRLLAIYKACGVTVEDFNMEFAQKTMALTTLMQHYNQSFLIPLDTDEFITKPIRSTTNPALLLGISVNRQDILQVFKGLALDGKKYKFEASYRVKYDRETCQASLAFRDHADANYRRVMNPGYFSWEGDNLPPYVRKTFFYSEGFIKTDQGNHYGQVEHDHHNTSFYDPLMRTNPAEYYYFTNLSLLHMSTSSYYGQKRKFLRGAAAYGHNETTDCATAKQGIAYCINSHIYRRDNDAALASYLSTCSARPLDSVSTWVFRAWFRTRTLSMQEIIGPK